MNQVSVTFRDLAYRSAVLSAIFLPLIVAEFANAQSDPRTNRYPDWVYEAARDKRIFDRQVIKGNSRVDPPTSWESSGSIPNPSYEWFEGAVVDERTLATMRRKFEPLEQDIASNKAFLEQTGTGIFKLLPGRNCVVAGFIVLTINDCDGYAIEGSAYSFRSATNTESESSDIRLGLYDDLHFDGFANNVLVTKVDVPSLNDLKLDRAELKFIREFEPAEDVAGFRTQLEIVNAIRKENGYYYSRSVKAVVGAIYVARTIAYKLDLPSPSMETRYLGRAFLIARRFKKSDRVDTLVAFSIVRKSDDGGFTILWKELERKKTTTLKVTKKNVFDKIFFR